MRKIEYNVNPFVFQRINNEESAYWLGFIYADGCMCDESRIQMILKGSDYHHLEKMKIFLNWNGSIRRGIRENKYDICKLVFRCKPMFEDLLALGCHPNKSKDLIFPTKEQVPDEFLFHFIRGYVDGDGSLGKLKRGNIWYPRFSLCGTYDFIDGMLNRTGWKRNKIQVRKDGLAIIEWQGKYGKEFAHQLYDDANIYLDRKYEIVKKLPF